MPTKKYSKEYTIKLNEAVHDDQTDSLIGLSALDSVRIDDSLCFKGELANGKVNLYKHELEVGKIIRFNFKEVEYKLLVLKVSTDSIKVKLVAI